MKNLLFVLILFFTWSCKKESEEVTPDVKKADVVSEKIIGTWNTQKIVKQYYDINNNLLHEEMPTGSISAYYTFDKTFGIFSIANGIPAKVKYELSVKDGKDYITTIGYNNFTDYEIVLLTGTDLKLKSNYSALNYYNGSTVQTAHHAYFVEDLKKQ